MSDPKISQPSPSITSPNTGNAGQESQPFQPNISTEDVNAKFSVMDSIGGALKNLSSLPFLLASIGSEEKMDFDEDGNQIVGMVNSVYKRKYRSSANLSEKEDLKKAIEEQKKSLEEDAKKGNAESLHMPEFAKEGDLTDILQGAYDALQRRLFGPLWGNWTNGRDFIAELKDKLTDIIDLFDPLMDMVDQLQKYFDSAPSSLQNVELYKTKNGEGIILPLGVVAMQSLNKLIYFIRKVIENLEKMAEEYTTEEIDALLKKGTSGSNFGTLIKLIQDLIQSIIDAIKPYIQNLIMALIMDAIDMIVDAIKKAGLLEPTGPLKLIPIAITMCRTILNGTLEEIEQKIKQTISKAINLLKLGIIAIKDPSILWADTDRMDKEIAIARYESLMDANGELSGESLEKFMGYSEESKTSGARHLIQKLAGPSRQTVNNISDWVMSAVNMKDSHKESIAKNKSLENKANITRTGIQEQQANAQAMKTGIQERVKDTPLP